MRLDKSGSAYRRPPVRAVAHDPCPACERGEHAECWESDPPPGTVWMLCPCTHSRPRFVVRPAVAFDLEGWTVWDTLEDRATYGWFGYSVRNAAQQTADYANDISSIDA